MINKNLIPQNQTKRMLYINAKLGKQVVSEPVDHVRLEQAQVKTPNSATKLGVFFSPLAKALAKEKGIDITKVMTKNRSGRVYVEDVNAYLVNFQSAQCQSESSVQTSTCQQVANSIKVSNEAMQLPQNSTIPAPASLESETRTKPTTLRKTIAKVMKNSWGSVAYTNLFLEVDVTKLWDLRNAVKDEVKEKHKVNLTFLAFIMKAIAVAVKDHPIMNSSYDDKTEEVVMKNYFNFGVAVDTKQGLVVPVIKDIDKLSIIKVASEIVRLGLAARDNKLSRNDISGGTLSITNYGSFGAMGGVPVINYPELAIVGVGTINDKVIVKNGQFQAAKSMFITVAADHRWIDGGEIARFASKIKQILEEPGLLWFAEEVRNV